MKVFLSVCTLLVGLVLQTAQAKPVPLDKLWDEPGDARVKVQVGVEGSKLCPTVEALRPAMREVAIEGKVLSVAHMNTAANIAVVKKASRLYVITETEREFAETAEARLGKDIKDTDVAELVIRLLADHPAITFRAGPCSKNP